MLFFSFDTEALNKSTLPENMDISDFVHQFQEKTFSKINFGIQQLYTIGKNKFK